MYYLAYGSNLHPIRLTDRIPGAHLVGTSGLRGYQMSFHKRSEDGSAKCTLQKTADPNDIACTAIYSVNEEEVSILDAIEGVGDGYDSAQFDIMVDDALLPIFTYIASDTHLVFDLEPYDWYKRLVLAGAQYHDFPAHYIERIAAVASRQDTDTERRIANENLLARIEESS
jgi:hypothetical protein